MVGYSERFYERSKIMRAAPIKNYVINNGSLIEDFEGSISDWARVGSTGEDSAKFKTGSKSFYLGTNGTSVSKSGYTIDTRAYDRFWVWVHTSDINNGSKLEVWLSDDPTFTNAMRATIGEAVFCPKLAHPDWNCVQLHKDDFVMIGAMDWNRVMTALKFAVPASSGARRLQVDSFYAGGYARPKILITFDDARVSAYTEAFTKMQSAGISGTMYCNGALIGQPSYMTLAQLQSMYEEGWDVANHTYNHVNLSTLSLAAAIDEIKLQEEWLTQNGFTRALKHFAYPQNAFSGYADDAVAALEFKTARAQAGLFSTLGGKPGIPGDHHILPWVNLNNTITLADCKAWVDQAIQRGSTLIFAGHIITATPTLSTEFSTANFSALVDYVISKRNQGLCDIPTISQWYEGLTYPRRKLN